MNRTLSILLVLLILTVSVAGCSGGGSRILYAKALNQVVPENRQGCRQIGFISFDGGGIVKANGKGNKILKMTDYQMSYPYSKEYDNYYYIHAINSPFQEMYGRKVMNWNVGDQVIESAGFSGMKSKPIIKGADGRFPSAMITSPKNRYLIYVMTKGSKKGHSFNAFLANDANSDLIIRDIKSGAEKVALKGTYNRALFWSFKSFSEDGKSFYTISREKNGFRFVKIDMGSGEIAYFEDLFPKFDWKKIRWNDYFPKRSPMGAIFEMAPDESILLVSKSDMNPMQLIKCAPKASHKLEAIQIEENKVVSYDEGNGEISEMRWAPDGKSFTFLMHTGGACYPDYMDSLIVKVNSDGQKRELLAKEEKAKMMAHGWSPNGKLVAYGVYAGDLVGRIKTVDVASKKIVEVVNSEEIDGSLDKNKPVTLIFVDWVE